MNDEQTTTTGNTQPTQPEATSETERVTLMEHSGTVRRDAQGVYQPDVIDNPCK